VLNQCGCVLRTCAQQGTSCGTTPDGCFGSLDCGGCSSGLVCTAGSCEPLICEQGWGDCDGDSSNGCEQDLSNSAQHCGACSQPCVCGDGACDVSEDSSTCPGDCAAVGSTLLVQQTINEQNYAVQCFNKGAWRLVWQATGAANNITTFVYKWPEQEPVLEHCGTPGNNGVYPLRIFNGSGLPSNGTLILQCFAPGQAHFYNVDAISLENAPMASYLSTEPSTACP
jgi:hypothetical protein